MKNDTFNSINEFVERVPEFNKMTSGEMIPYFVYYLEQNGAHIITPKMIGECFYNLSVKPYSNISSYLRNKSLGKNAIFLKEKDGYSLLRSHRNAIEQALLIEIELKPTNNLIDLSLLNSTPYYIKRISEQMNCCYDHGLYDACLVIMRKLFETLIIECYERFSCASEIKDANGIFYYFSELILLFLQSKHWSVSRNFEKQIKTVKKYGDLSAHNRRFIAKKSDIDAIKFDLRQCLQEIILIIDYQGWDRCSHTV